jgi:N6-adenosine-specific RNA methylase IME4/ParB-like chromosome segregation protein Spo0J
MSRPSRIPPHGDAPATEIARDRRHQDRHQELQFHPLADAFPLMEGTEFADLVADIKVYRLREHIVLYAGKILDGRNRYRACMAAGVEPRFETYEGDDPLAFVISRNLRRRHLDESQRAMIAAKLETFRHGGDRKTQDANLHLDRAHAAKLLNVGERSVASAATVRDHGAPELVHAVEQGTVSVSAAADIATQPIDEQRDVVARGEREILRHAIHLRARNAAARRAERNTALLKLSNVDSPFPDRRFPIILADPPYQFSRRWAVSREIENHYPTMTMEALCALPVANLATPDAMLFLWVPPPLLTDALNMMKTWTFDYATCAAWVKDKFGMGVYVRQQHELLLIGKRGRGIGPDPSSLSSSVIEAPRREHSRKPDQAYEMIERMYPPPLPKIELFARTPREGWEAWGNEIGKPHLEMRG